MAALRTLQDKIRRLTQERTALNDENIAVRKEYSEVGDSTRAQRLSRRLHRWQLCPSLELCWCWCLSVSLR